MVAVHNLFAVVDSQSKARLMETVKMLCDKVKITFAFKLFKSFFINALFARNVHCDFKIHHNLGRIKARVCPADVGFKIFLAPLCPCRGLVVTFIKLKAVVYYVVHCGFCGVNYKLVKLGVLFSEKLVSNKQVKVVKRDFVTACVALVCYIIIFKALVGIKLSKPFRNGRVGFNLMADKLSFAGGCCVKAHGGFAVLFIKQSVVGHYFVACDVCS